jgi:hypothetical protein
VRLRADGLVLVKSVPVTDGSTLQDLVRLGIVDRLLPEFLARGAAECRCIAADEHAAMRAALAAGRLAGTHVSGPSWGSSGLPEASPMLTS